MSHVELGSDRNVLERPASGGSSVDPREETAGVEEGKTISRNQA